MGFQAWLPLPLPKQLVVFGLGDWSCYSPDTSITVDVLVSPGVAPQRLGTLEPTRSHGPLCRSLVWEDAWRTDIFMASLKEMDKGNPVRLVLTVNGQLLRGVSSSTPAHPFLVPETTQSPVLPSDDRPLGQDLENPTGVKSQSSEVAARASRPVKKDIQPPLRTVVVPCALKSPAGKVESSEAWRKSPDKGPPRVYSKKPRKVLFEPSASERDLDEEGVLSDYSQACALPSLGSPSPRWCHAMCLSDLGTAVLIGGEGVNQQSCRDAFWKLEIGGDFSAKGRIPVLTYHSATIYHKELFVFGGTFPRKASLAVAPCSNVLYVFNPEHEIWYQPISEGEKPLPRLGHSATLLKNKLLIFGGRRTSLYLSDMHILD
ncbi:AFK kinase, partial [Panurus biarmicus]|nr:AFK kinase [Panurus biarmicus]